MPFWQQSAGALQSAEIEHSSPRAVTEEADVALGAGQVALGARAGAEPLPPQAKRKQALAPSRRRARVILRGETLVGMGMGSSYSGRVAGGALSSRMILRWFDITRDGSALHAVSAGLQAARRFRWSWCTGLLSGGSLRCSARVEMRRLRRAGPTTAQGEQRAACRPRAHPSRQARARTPVARAKARQALRRKLEPVLSCRRRAAAALRAKAAL